MTASRATPQGKVLSATMREAVKFARDHANKLLRKPGGFWTCADQGGRTFGTPTVQALVARGVASYTDWQEGRNGKFPIEASLTKDWI